VKKILKVGNLSNKAFNRYGRILLPTKGENPNVSEETVFDFYILFSQVEGRGWRTAYLRYQGELLEKLERHLGTAEVFIPLQGHSVLVVATEVDPLKQLHAFYLDKPLVIDKGIWHNVVSVGGAAELLIMENLEVDVDYYKLKEPMSVYLAG